MSDVMPLVALVGLVGVDSAKDMDSVSSAILTLTRESRRGKDRGS